MKRNRFQRTTSLFVMILIFMICFPSPVVFAASPLEKHVLILNAFTPDYPANELYSIGLKSKLVQNTQYKFSYSYEYFDLARYSNDKDYFEIVSQYLKAKYAKQQPDFIITAVNLHGLFTKYGKDIFPNVPIIMDWNEDNVPLAPIPSNYIAIPRSIDIDKNIQLILQTRPLTKTIYVVIGDSAGERNILKRILEVRENYVGQVEFVTMNKLSYTQMLERIRNATGDHSAILFIQWFSDVDGKTFVPAQVIKAR